MAAPKKVLFLCIGNSCRSPMAEALARHLAADVIEASSAGISPLGKIAEPVRRVLLERGVSCDGQSSKGLTQQDARGADLIVNMTGMRLGGMLAGLPVEDWEVEDPYGENMEIYRRVCDGIEERVSALAARLRAEGSSTPE